MYEHSKKSQDLAERLQRFMGEHIFPNEEAYAHQLKTAENRFAPLPLMDELKLKAKEAGLWNLFVPEEHAEYCDHGGLSFFDYAPLAEIMGRVIWCPEVFNCNAPDTGNMEVFMNYATEAQQREWLDPLLAGDIRSSYAMTEPQVASSDATNVELRIEKDGNEWVLNGHKWFITNAMYERTKILIVMGKSDPENPSRHLQQSQILVPKDTPGVTLVRPLTTLGYDDAPIGHAEIFSKTFVCPTRTFYLVRAGGLKLRRDDWDRAECITVCVYWRSAASLELACQRANSRTTFGRLLSKHQSVREDISKCFSEIEMARLLLLKACHKIDTQGVSASVDMIAATKTTIPFLVQKVIDRCMQIHGAGGLTEDYMMAEA